MYQIIYQSLVNVLGFILKMLPKGKADIKINIEAKAETDKTMAKKVSWKWGGKTYSGTLIRETKTHKYARTHNGKVKTIKK